MSSILTVSTAAGTQDLTTRAAVKAEIGIDAADGAYDDRINGWIHQWSAAIARACNRVFGQETLSEQFRLRLWEPQCNLNLRRWPVVSVTSVTEDGDALAASEYEIDKEKGILSRLSGDGLLYWSASKVVVVYVAGYNLPDSAPYDLQRACIEMVKAAYHASSRDPFAMSEDVAGIGRIAYKVGGVGEEAFPPNVKALLDPYLNHALA